jgi:hypothetical protein
VKFVLFVEGYTEQKAIPSFLKRWLDDRLIQKVGVKPVRFDGWSELVKDLPKKAPMHLHGPGSEDTIAVIGLLDLYGPTFYPTDCKTVQERLDWATDHLHSLANEKRFRMFFAVHEVEAWLLSNPALFPTPIRNALSGAIHQPETIDFEEPPAQLLDRLYCEKHKKHYKKLVDGRHLFSQLDPGLAYDKCPNLARMLDEMLVLAQQAGL